MNWKCTRIGPLLSLSIAMFVAGAGCTPQRLVDDTAETLEWLRLRPHTELAASSRWQLPRETSILVVEVAPAPDDSWLPAAQEGVDSVFPAPAAGEASFHLLVSWPIPEDERVRSRRVSLWEIVDMDQFLPDFQPRFALQVALVRSSDGALVEAAELEVTPRWLSGRSAAPSLVRRAFREFAAGFRPGA